MDRGDAPGMTPQTPIALTIAGSDSGGGAGVQADLKTFAALGVYGASVVTALTAQNTRGVRAIHVAPADIVARQIEAVMEDFEVAAIKIGMLGSAAIVEAVAERLGAASSGASRRLLPQAGEGLSPLCRLQERAWVRAFIVYDPVMAASSGDALSGAGFVEAVRARLLPLVDCLTPNLAEAAALLGEGIAESEADMARQGRALIAARAGRRADEGRPPRRRRSGRSPRHGGRRPSLRRAEDRLDEPARDRLHAVERDRRPRRSRRAAARGRRRRQGFRARAIEAGRGLRLGAGPGPLIQLRLRP